MDILFNQIVTLLTNPPGNLTYHLVLSFSIAGALQIAINQSGSKYSSRLKRLVLGFSLLLAIRLLLFLGAGISWQGLISEHLFLPPIDRTFTLLSLILIIWLWSFPEPSRVADSASIILGLLAGIVSLLNLLWWSSNGSTADFNGSLPSTLSEMFALSLFLIGAIVLIVRRPSGWTMGISMLGMMLLGHLAFNLMSPAEGDYSGTIRLAEMAAYPLLLTLPQQISSKGAAKEVTHEQSVKDSLGSETLYISIIEKITSLISSTDPDEIYSLISTIISHTMPADICLLAAPPDATGNISFPYGYNFNKEETLGSISLDTVLIPEISSSIEECKPLNLSSSSQAEDLHALGNALNLGDSITLLAAPVLSNAGKTIFAILLVSTKTNHEWTTVDQANLRTITNSLAQLLQQNKVQLESKRQMKEVRRTLKSALNERNRVNVESKALEKQLKELEDVNNILQVQANNISTVIPALEEVLETIKNKQEVSYQEDELKSALDEIARLKDILSEQDSQKNQ